MNLLRPFALRRLPVLLAVLLAVLLCALAVPRAVDAQNHDHGGGHAEGGHGARARHPDPRPDVTGRNVLSGAVVPSRARDAYTIAARIPSILDGLYCHCDCHARDEKRSLLECFENDMATTCGICQGEARRAAELHHKGKTLDEIRTILDEEWG